MCPLMKAQSGSRGPDPIFQAADRKRLRPLFKDEEWPLSRPCASNPGRVGRSGMRQAMPAEHRRLLWQPDRAALSLSQRQKQPTRRCLAVRTLFALRRLNLMQLEPLLQRRARRWTMRQPCLQITQHGRTSKRAGFGAMEPWPISEIKVPLSRCQVSAVPSPAI